ncbi:MAG: flavodoxin family protein [Candidatus Bathyarchaeia archaeon]|jgi:multimeric flavodoxin WrbA|nr:flavodoxin family protein [Candidatus Bathyarchaeota archaeon A05DMB-4]MDH7595317.1 flavodoxin family protein [Candidatus Bathyarchaeota archaeon]
MKVVGICGSPRKQATEFVLRKTLEMLDEKGFETGFFSVRNKKIGFCTHCDYCLRNVGCVFKDDMETVYALLKNSQGIIIATPVYNGGISAQTKAVMDRCRALVANDKNVFKHKVGMGIAVGGDRAGGQELALQQIHTFFILNGITPVSGGFFGANLGATFWSKDTLEGVKKDEEGFRSLRKTVKKFAECLRKPM